MEPRETDFESISAQKATENEDLGPFEAKYLVNYSTRALTQFVSVDRLLLLASLEPEDIKCLA